jgi:uncharacterized protein DUF3501
MTAKRDLTRADLVSMEDFAAVRADKRRALLPVKKLRRIALGPYATCYFESFDTMWLQVHEMLLIEKGGEAQIDDELSAYNPLVPKGNELICTLMLEIDDDDRRARVLRTLGGVEEHLFVQVADEKLYAVPEQDVERTTADGKTSSVHFLHFQFTASAKAVFEAEDVQAMIGCDHANYAHLAVLSKGSRKELAQDL